LEVGLSRRWLGVVEAARGLIAKALKTPNNQSFNAASRQAVNLLRVLQLMAAG
jgi:hypothetical protein